MLCKLSFALRDKLLFILCGERRKTIFLWEYIYINIYIYFVYILYAYIHHNPTFAQHYELKLQQRKLRAGNFFFFFNFDDEKGEQIY